MKLSFINLINKAYSIANTITNKVLFTSYSRLSNLSRQTLAYQAKLLPFRGQRQRRRKGFAKAQRLSQGLAKAIFIGS